MYTVGIGALYPPCMREDLSVQYLYSHYNFDIDEPLGCCEITSRNTAGTTTEQECHDITEGLLPTLLTLNQGSHRLEKFLNFEAFLEKFLKIKSALKSTGKSLKSLEKSFNLTIFRMTKHC